MTSRHLLVLTVVSITAATMFACGRDIKEPSGHVAVKGDVAPMRRAAGRELPQQMSAFSADTAVASETSANLLVSRATALGAAPAPPTARPAAASMPAPALPSAMLIRQGTASVQVDSLDLGISRVRDIARRIGGVIANTDMHTGKDELHAASIELRLPSERFDDAVSGLSPIGKLESVNVSVQDVGEEYVDVNARMTNARRLEERLIELLARRTGKLSDVLQVEHELARVREEIERYEGRLRYLRTRSSVSILTVTVHEPAPIVSPPGQTPIRDAFKQAWRNFVDVTAGLIASLGVLVPLGLLLGGLVWVGRRHLPWATKS